MPFTVKKLVDLTQREENARRVMESVAKPLKQKPAKKEPVKKKEK